MNDNRDKQTRARDDSLDQLLRQELRWEAPPDLTLRLLGLIPGGQAVVIAPPRPKSWYSLAVLVLTAAAVGISLAVAWQIYGALGAELGLSSVLAQLWDAPGIGLQRLYEALPASRGAVALLVAVRDQLHWLLLAIVLWLALDGWQPRLLPRRQAARG